MKRNPEPGSTLSAPPARDKPQASDGQAPSTWRVSAALFLAGFATFSLIYCTQPLLPVLSAEFHVGAAVSSLALSMTTGCLAVSILGAGAVSEAFGRRGLMFCSICAASVLNFVATMVPSWTMLLLTRAAEGLVLGGVPAIAMAYLAEEIPPARLGATMGLYVGGTAFGGMAGRVAIGMLTEVFSWRVAMGAMALLDLVVAFAFIAMLPPSRHFIRQPGVNLRIHVAAWRSHIGDRQMMCLFGVGFLVMSAFVTVYNYVSFRLAAAPYGLSQTRIGLIFLAYVFGIFASSAAGAMTARFGRAPVMICGAGVFLVGLALTSASGILPVIAGIAVVTIGFFALHSVASGSIAQLATHHKGHAASLYLLFYYAGSSAMGSLGGWIWHVGGWNAIIAYCGALVLGVVALALRSSVAPNPIPCSNKLDIQRASGRVVMCK